MFLLVAALLQAPPTVAQPRVISSPNWSDYRNYPPKARENEHEGRVSYRLTVDRSGRPTDCAIVSSSGSGELDSGTCRLAVQTRFQPLKADDGTPTEFTFGGTVFWLLDDERPIAASWIDADLSFDDQGKLVDCRTRGEGPYVAPWQIVACNLAGRLKEHRAFQSGVPARLTLSARVRFRSSTQLPAWPTGQSLAADSTRFAINGKGDASRCSREEDGEIDSNSVVAQNPCGQFLSQIWFETPPLKETPPRGEFEMRIVAPGGR